jgi:hypothetical protein
MQVISITAPKQSTTRGLGEKILIVFNCSSSNINYYIQKPIGNEELIQTVNMVIASTNGNYY